MTTAIELAKQCGIAYHLTPEGSTEMHGTDRQIQAFAEAIAAAAALALEREPGLPLNMAIEALKSTHERMETAALNHALRIAEAREACAEICDEQAARLAEAGNQDFPKDWDLWKRKVMSKG